MRLIKCHRVIALFLVCLLAFGTAFSDMPAHAAEITYVLNTNTKKFHRPRCSSVSQMKEKNRRDSSQSYDEILSQGYDPCQRCNPVPIGAPAGSEQTETAANVQYTDFLRTNVSGAAAGERSSTVTYVVNTNMGKFHMPSCSSVGDILDKNRMDSGKSFSELISEGYVPCKRCNPR